FADAADARPPVSSCSSAVRTTANVLAALLCVGVPSRDATCQAASDWLVAHQQPEGGWGELPWHDPEYIPGEGPVCVEDTAAAVDSLVAAGLAGLEAVGCGVDLLLDADSPAGLRQRCSALLALCRWAADENNEERAVRHVPAPPLRVADLADVPA
ncbi:MAG: hypothetical protein OES79_13365, partial [Planctomycetota bacterium]|nr:hypothetical protein [Planctomycetota bacterium]